MTSQNSSATVTLERKIRYHALDGIRGFALINMIVYHALWDLVYIFGVDIPWYRSFGAHIWQQAICWTFIFLSGFCRSLGGDRKSQRERPKARQEVAPTSVLSGAVLKRGLIVFGAGALVTLVTLLFDKQNLVLFGVLTLIGSCMLITAALDKPLKKCPPLVGFCVALLLFLLTKNVNSGYLGIGSLNWLKLPETWYSNYATAYLGFPPPEFHSTDYFALFPWIFLFLAGGFMCELLKAKDKLYIFQKGGLKLPEWLGRHSLIIYLVHQPAVYFVFWVLNRLSV